MSNQRVCRDAVYVRAEDRLRTSVWGVCMCCCCCVVCVIDYKTMDWKRKRNKRNEAKTQQKTTLKKTGAYSHLRTHICRTWALWRVWIGRSITPRAHKTPFVNCAQLCVFVWCLCFGFFDLLWDTRAHTHKRDCKEGIEIVQQRSPSPLSRTHHTANTKREKENLPIKRKLLPPSLLTESLVTDFLIKQAEMNFYRW